MRVLSVEFAGAKATPDQAVPDALPAVAFAGRSNVGKSSLINRMLGRTRTEIARVSSQPGKTQEINFYRVRAERAGGDRFDFFLSDLPGYGYAKVPVELRGRWKPLIESYLDSPSLRGVVHLVDARHPPSDDDRTMLAFLADRALPTLVALTKVDKLKGNRRRTEMAARREELGLDEDQVVAVSARTGEGCDMLLDSLEALLQEETS